ncbi:hypothetical protein [Kangiella taiwanensis]|uniref:Uncharacterized protein n=1 Tax=Kangiella taiwanensis TaxID=1079179 RepID=A0ABP8HV78_9GAMM|nr:hypothetical protein [Kangiella taiwanensis]
MSNDNLTPIDMGFAEFVAKLISEVFDAVVTSQAEQQEKLQELHELMALPEEQLVDYFLQQDSFLLQVDELLAAHFPSDDDAQLHGIYDGAPYQPKTSRQPEKPAVFEKLGLKLEKEDINANDKVLTETGVLKIYRKAASAYTIQKRTVMNKLIEQGLSNIVVDSGKINAKLTFSTSMVGSGEDDDSSGNTPETETSDITQPRLSPSIFSTNLSRAHLSSAIQPIQPINRYVGLLKPNINKQVRLKVKQASNKSPQDVEAKSNIFSEVELNFKTIR